MVLGDPILTDSEGRRVAATFSLTRSDLDGGSLLALRVTPHETLRADRVAVIFHRDVREIVEHGFQSWSTVRRARVDDVRPERAEAPRWFRGQMLADRDGAGIELAGDTFLIHREGVIGFLGARRSFTRCRVDSAGHVEVHWLLDGIQLRAGESVELDPLWDAVGSPGELYSRYAALAGEFMGARRPRPVPRVWCSWYHYFDRVTPTDVRANLAVAAGHGLTVVQIDDGWQREIGSWREVNDRWGEPLDTVARDIRAAGLTAGIWTAPFLAIENGTLAREHPEWLVQNTSGAPTTALFHAGWGGKIFALDTSRDDVLEHIATTYASLRSQGFDYFKIDFCHAGAVVGRRDSASLTRAQALRRGLEAVRDGIGDDAYLVGCGCPLLSAVGVVDAMRVSEDVAPFYEPREFFAGFAESTVSARNAIEASILRSPLHDRWFTLDPDCVLLRSTHTDLTAHERQLVTTAAMAASGFIVLSDDLTQYQTSQWTEAEQLFTSATHGPRDIVDPFAEDVQIVWAEGRAQINWSERRGSLDPLP